MAVELAKCIGQSSSTPAGADAFGLRASNYFGSEWPPSATQGQTAGEVKAIELSFYNRSSSSGGRWVCGFLNSFVPSTFRVEMLNNNSCRIALSAGGKATMHMIDMPAGSVPINEWVHLVVQVPVAGLVIARIGRHGRQYDGTASTADTFPYGNGGNGGFAQSYFTGGSEEGLWGLGWINNAISNYGGIGTGNQSGFISSFLNLPGGVSTMRVWGIQSPSDAFLEANKDAFIAYDSGDATLQNLWLNWRLNEDASVAADYDDTGKNGATWQTLLGGAGFDAHPWATASTDYTPGLGDSSGAGDAISIAVGRNRSLEDISPASDSVTISLGSARTFEDSSGASDSITVTHSVIRGFEDQEQAIDSMAYLLEHNRALPDAVSPRDGMVASATYDRSVSDFDVVQDSIAVSLGRVLTFSEAAIGAVETLEILHAHNRTFSEAVSASDVVAPQVALSVTLGDSVDASDNLAPAHSHILILSDSLSASDDLERTVTFVRDLADASSAADSISVSASGSSTLSLDDSSIPNDNLSITMTWSRAFGEASPADDTLSVVQEHVRSFSDTAGASDSVMVDFSAGGTNFNLTLSDSISAVDSIVPAHGISLFLVDIVFAVDNLQRSAAFSLTLEEPVSADDQIDTNQPQSPTFEDLVGVSDSILVEYSQGPGDIQRVFSDTVSVRDELSYQAAYGRFFEDLSPATDQTEVSLGLNRTFSDLAPVTDDRQIDYRLGFSELPFGSSDEIAIDYDISRPDDVAVQDAASPSRLDFEDQVEVSDAIALSFFSPDIKRLSIVGEISSLMIEGRANPVEVKGLGSSPSFIGTASSLSITSTEND